MTGFEPIIVDAAAKAVGGVVIKSAWDEGGKFLGWFGRSLDETTKQVIYQASREYFNVYTKRHGILKVLGMREPVSLDSLYITVQICQDRENFQLGSLDAVEKDYRQSNQRRFRYEDKVKIVTLFLVALRLIRVGFLGLLM